ncbi:MAG: hypothetical protein ACI8Y4_000222 [Candidatus Poriferisodalaceae bacterium]|jgi:hypothetical protein
MWLPYTFPRTKLVGHRVRWRSGLQGAAIEPLRSPPMGQPVRVVEKSSVARPGSFRYETNRPLTGMGHRRYDGPVETGNPNDPADVLANRLFERGGIDTVHINGSVITVDVSKGFASGGIVELIEGLFTHYTET